MPSRSGCLCLLLACSLAATREAGAQAHSPVSAEATVGFRVGHGGTYHSRGGAALDMVLAYRLREATAGTLVGGAALGAQSRALVRDLSCMVVADGGCAPDFPAFFSVAALAGVQRGSARSASARLLAGPTYHQALGDGSAIGLQGRADVSTPTWRRAAAVASLQHSRLPRFRGEAVSITSFGVGVRIE